MKAVRVPASPASPTLQDFASRINAAHAACEGAFKAGLVHAREAGELLLKAKELIPHGEWLPWLQEHCTVSERTAQGYMRVARRWAELEAKAQRVADLSYREAVALLAAPRPEADGEAPIPAWLAHYQDAGALSSEAVHELLTLAEDYGPDVRTDFPFGQAKPPATEDALEEFLNEIRPLEHPTLFPLTPLGAGAPTVLAAAQALFDDAGRRGESLPQWEVVAFWFASMMVLYAHRSERFARRFTGILAHHLRVWRESFRTALAWIDVHGAAEPRLTPRALLSCSEAQQECERAETWWGYYADLRHAGAWEAAQVLEQTPGAFPALAESRYQGHLTTFREQRYALPSVMQGRLERFELQCQ